MCTVFNWTPRSRRLLLVGLLSYVAAGWAASKLKPGAQLDCSWTSRKKSLGSPCSRLTEGWTDHRSVSDQVRMVDCIEDVCEYGKTVAFFISERFGYADILRDRGCAEIIIRRQSQCRYGRPVWGFRAGECGIPLCYGPRQLALIATEIEAIVGNTVQAG